jgi:hypothetical protein
MSYSFVRALSVVVAFAYVATLAACSSPQPAPATPGTAPAAFLKSHAIGRLEISRSGSGLMVRLINPKDGTAGAFSAYAKDRADCVGSHPCYIFSAIDGTAPMPVSAGDCQVVKSGDVPTAYCAAQGVSSVTIDAPDGGTIGYNAPSPSELGKNCFPSSLIYEVGAKGQYAVDAWDGCKETIRCAGKNGGTVDADSKDVIDGPCRFVDRH